MLKPEEYKVIEEAIFNEAVGGQDIDVTTVHTKLDKDGEKIASDVSNVTQKTRPNLGLLQGMLSERIGGPHDYC